MVSHTYSTRSGAARVLVPSGPMGQPEFSMSMICWARTPCGVPVLMRTPASPALAGGVELGVQPLTTEAVRMAAPSSASELRFGGGNVENDLEFQQRGAGGHRF